LKLLVDGVERVVEVLSVRVHPDDCQDDGEHGKDLDEHGGGSFQVVVSL